MVRAHKANRWAEIQVPERMFTSLSAKSTGEELHVAKGGESLAELEPKQQGKLFMTAKTAGSSHLSCKELSEFWSNQNGTPFVFHSAGIYITNFTCVLSTSQLIFVSMFLSHPHLHGC